MTKSTQLEKKISSLPPYVISELESYVDFLLKKNQVRKTGKLKQTWAGGLKAFKKKYTSMELQKKALEWRS
jgi:hypothetical protein